jgi:hypothetical protein
MKDAIHTWILSAGILLALLVPLAYGFWGYHGIILALWILSIGIFGYLFWYRDSLSLVDLNHRIAFTKQDWIFLEILVLLFLPIYLYDVYHIPVQVNTDEIVISSAARRLTSERFPDLFGLDQAYYFFPKFSFIFHGSLARLLGGVTLGNMRVTHAILGFLIVMTSYFFFRALRDPVFALCGSIVLGSNHALIAISRMAMRDNGPVMIELVTFWCLFEGIKRKNNLLMFMGGIAMGLSLYGYFPGRVIPVLWGLFLSLIMIFFRKFISVSDFLPKTAIMLWGACLTVAPILVSTLSSPGAGSDYAKTQLLFFEAGRALQQGWVNAATPLDGVKQNIINGLTVFNNKQSDLGYIYPNENHGFVDPITGILIWIGVVWVARKLLLKSNKEERLQSIFMLSSFFCLYFLFTFALTKTPNYTRLLITLPFVSYLAAEPLSSLAKMFTLKKGSWHHLGKVLTSGILLLLFGSNLWIFRDFLVVGWKEGNNVGGTIRYIESKKDQESYSFYLSASSAYPYYSWGTSQYWHSWTAAFSKQSQSTAYIPPGQLKEHPFTLPCTIFLQRRLWQENKPFLDSRFPDQIKIMPITPDQRLLAIEIEP